MQVRSLDQACRDFPQGGAVSERSYVSVWFEFGADLSGEDCVEGFWWCVTEPDPL